MAEIYDSNELQYLQMMQDNITRMATNSANSKTWIVTIITGFLAINSCIEDINNWLLVSIIPILVFWYYDAYYLRLERSLRNREQRFLNIKRGKIVVANQSEEINEALFNFQPYFIGEDNIELNYKSTCCTLFNSSVWPLYCILLFIISFMTGVINHWFCI